MSPSRPPTVRAHARRSRRTRAVAGALLLALALAACSDGSDDESSASPASDSAGRGAEAPGAAEEVAPAAPAPADGAASDATVVAVQDLSLSARTVVRTAAVTVVVEDVRAAASRAGQLAVTAGGELEQEETSEDSASLRLRVPPSELGATLTGLAALGQERQRTLGSEDVTEQVVDLDSRLATQRASVARVRELLDRATGIAEVVAVEAELARREAELEALLARLESLRAAADLATVTVSLVAQEDDPAVAAVDDEPGFADGLSGGWEAFQDTARVVLLTLGATLPFVPLLLVGLLVARWWRRRDQQAVPSA